MTAECTFCHGQRTLASCVRYQGEPKARHWITSCQECNGTGVKDTTAVRKIEAHHWVPSTLGHGELMCRFCKITNREAGAIGQHVCEGGTA